MSTKTKGFTPKTETEALIIDILTKEDSQKVLDLDSTAIGICRIGGEPSGWVNFKVKINFKTKEVKSIEFAPTTEKAGSLAQAKIDFINIFSKLD